MMSSDYGFLYNKNLPSEEIIVARCQQVGYNVTGTTLLPRKLSPGSSLVLTLPSTRLGHRITPPRFSPRLDSDVRVPRVFHAFMRPHPACPIGYIAMEYIEGADCHSGDVDVVAKAVQTLIGVPAPSRTLGHVGGGAVVHSFFLDWIPVADYKSVEDLDAHINNILKHMGDPRHVNIVADAERGLYLCPCDVRPGNFRKCTNGQLFALDFAATCFMPPSFVGVAMKKSQHPFCRGVAKKISYTQSPDVSAIVSASNYLVPFGYRAVAFPPGLKLRRN